MGQLKFEKKFSEKLNEREIEPTSGSWEELNSRLESEQRRRNPMFWWVGIAASLVGGILISSLLFMNDPVTESNSIVDKPSEEFIKESNKNQTEESLIAAEEKEKVELSNKTLKSSEERNKAVQNSGVTSNKATVSPLVSAEKTKNVKRENIELAVDVTSEENIGNPVPEEAIAEVSLTESESGEVTNSEVDALLAEASSQINKRPSNKFYSEKISANDLLWDVEMELEASFREKVFEVLKDGYLKARTAVANRNY